MGSLAFSGLEAVGLQALNILSPGAPQRSIGGIIAQLTISEVEVTELTITEFPVEQGANISDHAYLNPFQVTLTVGWSNSGYAALSGAISSALSASSIGAAISDFTSPSYVNAIYAQLRALQATRKPFTIVTGRQQATNMLIRSISITTDTETENGLIVTCICRQVIIVSTTTTSITAITGGFYPSDPQNTTDPANVGPKSLTSADSVNKGAYLPNGVTNSTPVLTVPVQPAPLPIGGALPGSILSNPIGP